MKPMLAQARDEDWLLEIEPDPDWIVTRKWNGIRLIPFLNNTGNRLLTRSGRNVIASVPQFQTIVRELDGTILDSEGISPEDYLGDVQSALHSKQITAGARRIKLVLFDCLKFKNESLTHLPLRERREYLKEAYKILKPKWPVILETHTKSNKKKFYKDVIREGIEGVMTKDLLAAYYPGLRAGAWVKVKPRNTYEFVILGFTRGTGKYAGQVGAIRYGALYEGEMVEVGRSSGMTDQERLSMTLNPNRYIGKVAEFEAQELTRAGVMLHPSFIQLRPDLDPYDIHFEC